MRGLMIVAIALCGLLAVDHYRFDGFYTDKVIEMGQKIVQGVSR